MIVAMCGQKGGSGKTTAALAAASELLARGKRVLLVDADPQGSVRTWADVAAEAEHPAPTVVAMGAQMHKPGQLDDLAAAYDLTIIDCPPRHGEIQRAALMIADLAVLPCGPSAVDAWAMAESVELVQKAQALRPELRAVALITRRISRTTIGAGAREALRATGLRVMRAELYSRVAYQEAPAAGLGVAQYAPRDKAAREVNRFVDELMKELANGKKAANRAKKAARRRSKRA
jgi:chromosome partitioning protein